MTHKTEPFIYSGVEVPIGGLPGDILTKINGPNYYTAWRDITYILETYDVIIDDGEF